MNIEELPVPRYVITNLQKKNIRELYPPQVEAVKAGVLEGKNIILSTPTASGKTLIALLAASIHLTRGGKVLYLVPLRALASEKVVEIDEILCSNTRFKVAISTGDYDSSDPWLKAFDIIVSTNEKTDSLLRHGAPWIRDITLVVLDELHLISDSERGPALEMVITRLTKIIPRAQYIGLSATISNAHDLGRWLKAEVIQSDWRPVPLKEGILKDLEIEFKDGERKELKMLNKNLVVNAVLNIIEEGGQALVFASTRKKAEDYALKIAQALSERLDTLSWEDRERLSEYARELLVEERSSFTENLAKLVEVGVAFHHAGLSYHHRRIVEEAFRSRILKTVVSTPTLAAGVNLPARLVLITEVKRYIPGYGYQKIPVIEYKQFCGRAGRPIYDNVGYAITISRTNEEKEYILEEYINGELEKITSRLGSEKHLRTHVLAIISSAEVDSIKSLIKFFEDTYLGNLYGASVIKDKINVILRFLKSSGFIEINGQTLKATRLGVRVAQLYIDPLTANILLENLSRTLTSPSTLGLLHLITSTPEVPKIPMKRLSPYMLEERLEKEKKGMVIPIPDPEDQGYEEYIEALRLAMVLEAWIEEVSEAELYDRFGVQPGDLFALREASEWIAYSASQISKVAGYLDYVTLFERLSERIRYGVREELIPLTRLKGIGRVRARALYRAGYTSLEKLRSATLDDLVRVLGIGRSTAEKIVEQL
ncbi:MAG: DEAD/DEAH box helicase [Aigarchaeota archaeon]|nr:DEAD/DEAH box helicase [Aigarchaeota archaeon]MCX8192864.1 DEAD/DEAH box helicase [Nitrososphaeria archaeon]MDW7986592.1 DEAD/DEAH box helicase [Nitrososphaerota archaeon]